MLPEQLRSLPYLVHTNRELGLMLAGIKPLANFIDGKGLYPEVMERYLRLFDRHVEAGTLVRADYFYELHGRNRTLVRHRILFALPGEEWRMQAMADLFESDVPWSPELERREGELLGYEDWMNDYWLENVFGRGRESDA